MSHTRYFCHQCQNEFIYTDDNASATAPSCPQCSSDFVELITELTFTREERRQRLAAHQIDRLAVGEHLADAASSSISNAGDSAGRGRRRARPVDSSNSEDESSTAEMLFGPNGIFASVIPAMFPLPTEEEDDEDATAAVSTMEAHTAGPTQQGSSSHEEGGGTQGRHRRRRSFGQLMGSVVPHILRYILRLRSPQPESAAEAEAERGREADAREEDRRMRRLPGTTFSFTTGTGERGHARVTVVSADEYTCAWPHICCSIWTANQTGINEDAYPLETDGTPQSISEMIQQLLGGQFGDYVVGERRFDEIITRLMEEAMNQRSSAGPPPMTDKEIQAIPKVIFRASNASMDEDEREHCTICREVFEEPLHLLVLVCSHRFHEECITPWLKTTATCPVCRRDLRGEETPSKK